MPSQKRMRSSSPTGLASSKRRVLRSTSTGVDKIETAAYETAASETTAQTSPLETTLPLSPIIAPRGRKGGTVARTAAPRPKPSMSDNTTGAASVTRSSEAAAKLSMEAAVDTEPSTGAQQAIRGSRTVVVTNDREERQMLLRVENLDSLQTLFMERVVAMLDRPDVMERFMQTQ